MSPSLSDSQTLLRPSMRRKSSAQNLLSSFKSSSGIGANNNTNNNNVATTTTTTNNNHGSAINGGSSASTNGINSTAASTAAAITNTNGAHASLAQPGPPVPSSSSPLPLPPPPPPPSSATSSAIPTPSASGTSTPVHPPYAMQPQPPPQQQQQQPQQQPGTVSTVPPASTAVSATPIAREWDAQSLYPDSAAGGQFLPPVGGAGAGMGPNPGATIEYLRDLVQKRIITLTYMRNVHDGRSHWFHTIMMSRSELDRVFNNAAMKKRTHRFAILAMSLSSLFDISHPTDCLRAALNMLTEYEQAKEENDRPKMRLWKRPSKRQAGMGDYPLSMPDTSDTYLTVPHMSFPLDYTQTLLSLLDILSAFYAKLAKLLGPSPFPHASQHMLGLSPHPGVSYLFQNQTQASAVDEALWSVALGSTAFGGTGGGGVLHSPPPSWTPALGELVLKVDSKFKKIISILLKELDVFARNSIKDELASLDPLLRNVGGAAGAPGEEGGPMMYEFEQ